MFMACVKSSTEVMFSHSSSRLSFFIVPFAHQFYCILSNKDGDGDGDAFKQKSLIMVS